MLFSLATRGQEFQTLFSARTSSKMIGNLIVIIQMSATSIIPIGDQFDVKSQTTKVGD